MNQEPAELSEDLENAPEVGVLRELLCARLDTLAPELSARVREATESLETWSDVIAVASQVVAKAGIGSDLDDLINLDEFLESFGLKVEAGSERTVAVRESGPTTTEEIIAETKEGIFRRQLYIACEGVLEEGQRQLLLTTHPLGEEPVEVLLYNIAVIWLTEALMPAGLKGKAKQAQRGLAREKAINHLAEKGIINPSEEA